MNAGSSSSPYFTLTLPNEFVTYNVRVAAVNTRDLGSAQSNALPLCPGKKREGLQRYYILYVAHVHLLSCCMLCLCACTNRELALVI